MQDQFEYKSSNIGSIGPKSNSLNLDEAQGIVECFVAGIGNKDSVGDIVAAGAFTKSLQRRKPRVVWGHNWNDPIGKVLEIYEVSPNDPRLPMKMKVANIGGLFAKVQFNLNSEKGKEAFANVAFFGEEQEWSIGYKTLRAQFDQKSQANVIWELELYEVSPVLHGANQLTGTISVKTDMMSEQINAPTTNQQSFISPDREELQKQLSNIYGSKINIVEADEETVTFIKPGEKGGYEKYKCNWMRNQGTFMFGTPQRIQIPQITPQQPPVIIQANPSTTNTQPQRIIRPQQMPAIPVAIKPNPIGPGTVMIPLPKIEYEGNQPKIDKENLDKEESELRDALLKIVKRHGKFNEDSNGVWAGYYPPERNPVAGIGVKCSNCVMYEGGSSCKIISLPVHPEGKCRFAVIPNGVVKGDYSDQKAAADVEAKEQEDYLIELEVKYPGELLLAGLRGAISRLRRRKRRKKYKDLSEFNEEQIDEKGYCLEINQEDAFRVKQILDPIFDYYRAETFVDMDGIVIQSGLNYDLIDAIDTAFTNNDIKKKLLDDGIEVKNLGRRIASYGASRLIDRPRLGGGRGRGARGFGIPEGDLNPETREDRNRNGWLFDEYPDWRQPDPTPYGPGSIYNRDTTPQQEIDKDKTQGELIEGKPIQRAESVLPENKKPVEKTTRQAPRRPKENEERRLSSGRNLSRHGLGKQHEQKFGISRDEKQRREDFDKIVQRWNDSGMGWEQRPRTSSDKNVSENLLRGMEMGENQARVAWAGTGRGNGKRPENFNEKNKSTDEYMDWFMAYAGHLGNFVKAVDGIEKEDRKDFNEGLKKAIANHVAERVPNTSAKDGDTAKKLAEWLNNYGYNTDISNGRLSSGQFGHDAPKAGERGRVRNIPGLDDGFDPDNPFGDENMPYDLGFDVYDKIIEDFLGPEDSDEERPIITRKAWSDEEIYNRRMKGATLQEVADTLGWSRQDVRKAEQRHMQFLRTGKKIERPENLDKPRPRTRKNLIKKKKIAKALTDDEKQKIYEDIVSGKPRRKIAKEKGIALSEVKKIEEEKAKKAKESAEIENQVLETAKSPEEIQKELDEYDGYGRISSGANAKLNDDGPVGFVLSQVTPKRAERLSSGESLNESELQKYYDNMQVQILESIMKAIKNPGAKFVRPWARTENYARNPTNKRRNVAGRAYEGSGQVILSMKGFDKKYPTARWAGEKQWKSLGGKVRKGEKPTFILAPTIERGRRTGEFHMTKVYNVAQIEGLPNIMYAEQAALKLSEKQRIENVQKVVSEIGPVVEEGNFGGAFFSPSRDTIFMPKFGQFNSPVEYYSTLMHELTHWSGASSRLDRPHGKMTAPEFSPEFKKYAFEELIAEIGSSLLMGMLGIEPTFRDDHGVYLKSWADAIQNDHTALRRAMLEAQKAVNYLINRSPTLRQLAGFEPDERKHEADLKYEIPLIEGMVGSEPIPKSGPIRGTFEQPIDEIEDARLSSGKIEDFATRPHKSGKTHKIGNRGWTAIDRQNGDREVYHYSTMMGVIRNGEYFEISTGWNSVSDKQGIKKILKALGQKEPRQATEMQMLDRLSSGKIEDFVKQPHVDGRKIKAGSGGAWSSFDLSNGDREIYHYSTKMGFIRNGVFYQESDGWNSVSDKQGINKILRSLNQPNAIRVQQVANLNTDDETRFVSLPQKDEDGKVIDVTGRLSSGGGYISSVKNPDDKKLQIKRVEDVSFQFAHNLPHEPTQQQKDVIEVGLMAITGQLKPFKNKQGQMVYPVISVQAAAGTGKTTTLKMLANALDNLFNLEIGNDIERAEKLNYISQRFSVDFSKMTEKQIKDKVEKLKEQYGSKSLYYAVFNKKNQLEAQAAFPGNTGVSTLDKIARWGLLLGAADKKFGDHISRKMEAAGARVDRARDFDADGNPIGAPVTQTKIDEKTGKEVPHEFTYIDFRDGQRKPTPPHPTATLPDGSQAGQRPTLEHTGLRMLDTNDDYQRFFKLEKLAEKGPLPGSDELPSLDVATLAEIIKKAVEKWTLSGDEELQAKHFAPDEDDVEARLSGFGASILQGKVKIGSGWVVKKDASGNPIPKLDPVTGEPTGKFQMTTEQVEVGSTDHNPQFWVDVYNNPEAKVPQEWLKMGRTVVEHLLNEHYTDEKGKKQKTIILPNMSQTAKIFSLSNPDLSEAKYMVGHALGSTQIDAVPSSAKRGDVTDRNGKVITDVSKVSPDTPLWIVTSVSVDTKAKKGTNRTVTLRRTFAHPNRKLNALLIDEAQDINPTFLSVLENNREKLPIILVGDERQSVYDFRNALNAMELMDPDYVLPLNESFRFGNNIAHLGNIIQALINLDAEALAKTTGQNAPRRQWVTGHHHQLIEKQFNDAIALLEKFDTATPKEKTALLNILKSLDKEFKLSKRFTVETKQKEDVLIFDEGIPAKDKIKFLNSVKDKSIEESKGFVYDADALKLDKKGRPIPVLDADGNPVHDDKHNIIYQKVDPLMPVVGETFAFLGGTNNEVIKAAFRYSAHLDSQMQLELAEWRLRNPSKKEPPQLVPQVAISAKKHEDIVDFLKHYQWIWNAKFGKTSGKKPPASKFIGNIWDMEQLRREAQRPNNNQLRALWKLMNPKGESPVSPSEMLRRFNGGFINTGTLDSNGNPERIMVNPVVIPERQALRMSTKFDKLRVNKTDGEDSLEELLASPTTKLKMGVGDSQIKAIVLIEGKGKGDAAQRSAVHWNLEISQRDPKDGKQKVIDGTWNHDPKKPGEWTGRVVLTGQGITGQKTRGQGSGIRKSGFYFEDAKRIITRDPRFSNYFDFVEDGGVLRRAATGSDTARNDAYVIDIKDLGGSRERLSEIIRQVSEEILEAANTTGADAVITTPQLFKGMEAHTVVVGESYKDAFEEIRDNFAKIGQKSPQFREGMHLAYVAATRAQKQIDIGPAFAEFYYSGDRRSAAQAHIAEEVARLRKTGDPEDKKLADSLEEPKDFVYPRQGGTPFTPVSDDDDDRVNAESEQDPTQIPAQEDDNEGTIVGDDDGDSETGEDEDNLAGGKDVDNEDDDDRISSGKINYQKMIFDGPKTITRLLPKTEKIWNDNFEKNLKQAIKEKDITILDAYRNTIRSNINKIQNRKNLASIGPDDPDMDISEELNDTYLGLFDLSPEDLAKRDKFINDIGKAANVMWALNNVDNQKSSPKTRDAAKKILNDANQDRLSSGRSERRVIKSLEDVQQNMKYDHSAATDKKLTEEQIAVSDAIMTGDNVIVRALAGTGKTSTLLVTAKRILDQEPDKRIVYLTFTKKMQEEAKKKFANYPNVEVRTWDSVATSQVIGTNAKLRKKSDSGSSGIIGVRDSDAIANHYGFSDYGQQVQVKNRQGDLIPITVGLTRRKRAALMARIATEFSTGRNPKTKRPHEEINRYVVTLAAAKQGISNFDLFSREEVDKIVADAQRFWNDSFDENSPLELSRSYVMKQWSLTNPDLGTGRGMSQNVDGNDIVFFDEAQDSNPVMTDIVRKQKIQWVAVGDSNQAIYEFRGAVDELEDMEAKYQLTLTKTFRFGRAIQGIANRFLAAHQKRLRDRKTGESPIFSRLRIDAAGQPGELLEAESFLPEGIGTAATRAIKKNGERESLAFISLTNAVAFERIIEEQEKGKRTGSVSTFKKDLTDMINHAEWLKNGKTINGKEADKPKSVFPELWSVASWAELAKAAGGTDKTSDLITGETIGENDGAEVVDVGQQAITAYRLFKKFNFDWDKLRKHVDNIETTDGGKLIGKKVTASDLVDEFDPVEIVSGGTLIAWFNPKTNEVFLGQDGGDFNQHLSYKVLYKDKYKFKFGDPEGKFGLKRDKKGWYLQVQNIDAGASVLNNLIQDIENGIPAGDSPEFNSIKSFTPIVEGNGKIFNYLKGAKYSYFDKYKKNRNGIVDSEITLRFKNVDGKFIAVAEGNTYPVKDLLKKRDPKTNRSTFTFVGKDKPQYGEAGVWLTEANSIEELYEKLENLRKANDVAKGGYTLKPTSVAGAGGGDLGPDIIAQTSHRSKGLEFDNLILAGDFKAPKWDELSVPWKKELHEQGRLADPDQQFETLKEFLELLNPKEKEQFRLELIDSMGPEELRLQYVANTRAMKRLIPGSTSWILDVTDPEDEEFTRLSSGKVSRKASQRANRRQRLSSGGDDDDIEDIKDPDDEEIMKDLIENDLLPKVPTGEELEAEYQDLIKRGEFPPDERISSGRASRRLRKNNRLSSGRTEVKVDMLHGFSDDEDFNRIAQNSWRQIRQRGWLLNPADDGGPMDKIGSRKTSAINNGISNVGTSFAKKKRNVKIGDVSKNDADSANQETWMLPTEKLKKMISIPTAWGEDGKVTERRPIDNKELSKLLNLNPTEEKKLDSPNAGLSYNDVMYLIAEIGNEPIFDSWRLFAPTKSDEKISNQSALTMAMENLGRAKFRERFLLETFGKDAFPMYIDSKKGVDNKISQSDYSILDDDERFSFGGAFRNDGDADDANTELMYEGMRAPESISALPTNKKGTEIPNSTTRTKRDEFRMSELMKSLGISDEDKEKYEKLNKILKKSKIGEQNRQTLNRWETQGIPTAVISEMIQSKIIKDAKSTFTATDAGARLDRELARPKYVVAEALLSFIKEKHGTSGFNTRDSVTRIMEDLNLGKYLERAAKNKGSIPYSPNVGDIPRYSDSDLENVVNRFNNIFGTDYTVDDIFSDEQLRTAKERIETGTHSPVGKPNVRTRLKKENE